MNYGFYGDNFVGHWRAWIQPKDRPDDPCDSPYKNGIFEVQIGFTENYPFEPPRVKFNTKVLHPKFYEKFYENKSSL